MAKRLFVGLVLILSAATGVSAGGAGVFFDGCSVLDSGTPWQDHVMYTFLVQAGPDSINDVHMCVVDRQGQPVEIVAISHPECWNGHFEPGSSCVDYWTDGQAIAPGEALCCFDFIVPPGFCSITIEWVLTFGGVGVAAGFEDWTCIYTDTQESTWSAIKALYH